MAAAWKFRLLRQDLHPRRLILEGYASPPLGRSYYDELFFYLVAGDDYLSLEVSRDFDGDRLVAHFIGLLGEPGEPLRIQVGGRQDEEEGAMSLVQWRFAPAERAEILQRLARALGHPLTAPAPDRLPPREES